MTSISVYAVAHVPAPRGATWAASAALAVGHFVKRLVGSQATAAAPSPAAEAAAVRALAREFVASDPGFAADLFAAADRHERQYDAP